MRLPAIACIHAKAVQTAGINKKRVRAMDHRKGLRIGLTVLSILGALMAVPDGRHPAMDFKKSPEIALALRAWRDRGCPDHGRRHPA